VLIFEIKINDVKPMTRETVMQRDCSMNVLPNHCMLYAGKEGGSVCDMVM
jgi:hypothetical protein